MLGLRLLLSSALLLCVSRASTVLEVIKSNPELSQFAIALELSGLDLELNNNKKQYTVFAPSNEAIAKDEVFTTYMSRDGWVHHLKTNIQLMIVPSQALSDQMIFDKFTTELVTLNGTLQISQPYALVNLVEVTNPNQAGSNGVVHTMNGVVKPYWRGYTLREVEKHDELVEGLSPQLKRIKFDKPLEEFVPSGVSWVASRNRGYGNDSIAQGFFPIVQELKDPNNTEFQNLTYMYNLIDFNLYEQDIERGFQLMVMPRGDIAHMWITKDQRKGLLRFNDAILDRQAFANNGITQIVTKPLVPPGLAMIMNFCAEYTTINLKDMYQYYRSSEWNLRNLTRSIGTQQGSFNVFAPLQSGYGEFNIEVGVRISTLEWKRHLWDFLLHMTVEPAYTTDELYKLVEAAGGYMQMKMLSGFNTTLEFDEDGELTIDGARLLKPYDMKGVDGYIHLVERVPLPPSVLYTIYDQTQMHPEMTTVTRLIDTVQMGPFIDNLLPVTFFSAVNSAWDVIIPQLQIEDVIKSMTFELLWFDDYLAEKDGEQLTSTNGKKWNIQVFPDPDGDPLLYAPEEPPVKIYISNADGPEGLTNCTFVPGANRTNILARTGVIHHIDCLLLYFNYTKVDKNAPTFAPVTLTQPPEAGPAKYGVITTAPVFPTPPPVFTTQPVTADSAAGLSQGLGYLCYLVAGVSLLLSATVSL
ncbi:expressed unknown protein [Seminavis robusta]|uniref:FAS1 domain-containing protein n=1 Tax=Seminavis robusta TaxID=568900 RepID=A0A9N8HBH1_9STRA|nr:expressed unknown protein [Seminavis robusta]|eukprot:Sro276_g106130.1 n/a (696) ;mRNA; r:77706-80131